MLDYWKQKDQIFFIPFAGGNSFSYNFLLPQLKPNFDIAQLELPGRGKRMGEPLLKDGEAATIDYVNQIISKLNGQSFLIFGHSMGATLGLRITKSLEEMGHAPEYLIVSGNSGPGLEDEKKRHLLKGQYFLDELKRIGGMPDEFFEHEDLVKLYIPILKSDFKICETPPTEIILPVKTPIMAMMGHQEEHVSRIKNWSNYTTSEFHYKVFKGNHFFIYEHRESIIALINRCFSFT